MHETDAALYQEKEGTYIMDNFTFYAPTYFVFGKDTENETGKYVKKFGEAESCFITAAVRQFVPVFLTE